MTDVKVEREVIAWNPPIDWVKEKIEDAGTTIGSVHFIKRTNGKLRKMSYRLHVQNPTVASKPKGLKKSDRVCMSCGLPYGDCLVGPFKSICRSNSVNKKVIDKNNDQITVLDANSVVRDKDGLVLGRGQWRTVPLENVVRIRNKGTTYIINKF